MWEMHGMQGGIGDSDDERNRSGRVEVIPTSYPTRGIPSPPSHAPPPLPGTSEDLHAWSIYRQNLNSDFTDSALGSTEKSPLPYGNFHLRDQTMASILSNPKYQPHGGSELGTNAFTYLKFGLPRIVPPKVAGGSSSAGTPGPDGGGSRSGASVSGGDIGGSTRHGRVGSAIGVGHHESSGYDSTDEEDEDPSSFHRNRNPNFPTKSNHSKFVADQQMHPSRARSVGPQPKFSHKQNNVSSHHNHAGLLRAARSEDYILGSISRNGGGQELRRGGDRTAELRNRFERTNEGFSYEDGVADLMVNNPRFDENTISKRSAVGRHPSERRLRAASEANLLAGSSNIQNYQIDSDIDFRNGVDRVRRSRSRVEDITDSRHTRRSRSRQSHEGNHLVYNPSNIPPITDTSDAENPHSGQPYNNLNGRLGDNNYGRNKLSHRTASQLSVARQKEQDWRLSYRPEGPMLNNKYFPRDHYNGSAIGNGHGPTSISSTNKIMDDLSLGMNGNGMSVNGGLPYTNEGYDAQKNQQTLGYSANGIEGGGSAEFKYPHLQLRDVSCDVRSEGGGWETLLNSISLEAKGGEILAILSTKLEEGSALCDIIANSSTTSSPSPYEISNARKQSGGCFSSSSGCCGITSSRRIRGSMIVNGVQMPASSGYGSKRNRLRDRVAYVRTDCNFTPDMSVRQTMLFHAFLREPGTHTRARDTKGRINALVEDLGLAQVRHTRVKDLTVSEKQRLNVACHLLLDADIVVLDRPTRGMDIFDTFFLVEYLRQWAARGRIVILTLQPPTYEILTMISKVVLVSTGRVMYYGKRREMLPYFAFIDYPCPAYKNPSDYYLDLVTLDNLSSEAMLESSQRINQLASTFKRRAEPLSDPGPPGIMPPKVKRANLMVQIVGLLIRAFVYMFPFNVIDWVKRVLLAGVMSVLIGTIYLGVRWQYWNEIFLQKEKEDQDLFMQANIGDRFGFHHVMMAVGIWPVMIATIGETWRGQAAITRDVEDGLYSKTAYIITKMLYNIPSSGGIFLAYIIPAYLLAGLHREDAEEPLFSGGTLLGKVFFQYIGYMLLYLFTVQMMALGSTYLIVRSRHVAASLTGAIFMSLTLASGYLVHSDEVGIWASWSKYISPQWWMQHLLYQDEFIPRGLDSTGRDEFGLEYGGIEFGCQTTHRINEIIQNGIEIQLKQKVPCGLEDGFRVLRYFQFLPKFQRNFQQINSGDIFNENWNSVLPIGCTFLVFILTSFIAITGFLCRRQSATRSRSKLSKM